MISRIELQNFQAHKRLELDLDPFTVFSGPSNSAKSSVLRALAAMLRNDSAGDFLPWDGSAKNISVKVFLEDGHAVLWEKGKDNQYTVTRPDGKVSAYKKVGASVPEEVMEVLCIGPIVMEDGTKVHVNLHEQQESPFLLMDTPGYVAKVFGELTSAGKLFSAASEGNRRTREEKKLRTLREADVASVQAELTEYVGIEETKERLRVVGEKISTAGKLSKAHDELASLADSWKFSQDGIRTADQVVQRLAGVERIDIHVISQLDAAQTQLSELMSVRQTASDTLSGLDERLPSLERSAAVDLDSLHVVVQDLRALDCLKSVHDDLTSQLSELPEKVEVFEADFDTMLKLNSALVQYFATLEEYWAVEDLLAKSDEGIAEDDLVLKAANDALDEIDTCPTCNQPVQAGHLTGTTHGA